MGQNTEKKEKSIQLTVELIQCVKRWRKVLTWTTGSIQERREVTG